MTDDDIKDLRWFWTGLVLDAIWLAITLVFWENGFPVWWGAVGLVVMVATVASLPITIARENARERRPKATEPQSR